MPSILSLLNNVIHLTVWLVLLAVIFVPLERLFALRPRKILRQDVLADLGFYFLNSLVTTFLIALPMAVVAALAGRLLPHWWFATMASLPLWLALTLNFLVGDLGFYWGHRISHAVPFLWQFHRVHHSPDGLDWLVSARQHPVDMIFTRLCGLVPIYLLGLSHPDAQGSIGAMLVVVVGTIWGFFIHANIRVRLGPLEQILATPYFHHWHHVRTGPINRNYAPMLPLYDRLFGTLHLPRREWPDAYGVDERAPGVTTPSAIDPVEVPAE